jgi:Flp pilus assembly protein TadD
MSVLSTKGKQSPIIGGFGYDAEQEAVRAYRGLLTSTKFMWLPSRLFVLVAILMCIPGRLTAQHKTTKFGCDAPSVFKEADQLLKVKRYDETQVLLASLARCHGLSPLNTFSIGWFYGRAHNFNKALEIFESVDPDVPDMQTHQYAVALGQFELGRYQAAADTLKPTAGQRGLDPDAANLLGVSYSKLGLYQDAYTTFVDELHRTPSDMFAYLNLITLLADAGKFADAANVASRAVEAFPGNPDVLVVRGAALTLVGQVGKAREDFAAAVHLAPKKSSPQFLLALSDYTQGDYTTAATELRGAIRAGILDADLHYLLAECMLKLNPTKPKEALVELDRAITLNGTSVSARTLRGKLLLAEDHAKEADVDLEMAHRVDPASRSATYNLARVDMALGKTEQAKQLFGEMNKQTMDGVSELGDRKLKEALTTGTTH